MNKKLMLILFLAFSIFIKADVAPDPDEIRMTNNLVIETVENVSDYRFFLNFYGAVHEIEVVDKGRSEIQSPGGGARYSSGTLIAIPKKSLTGQPQKLESPFDEVGKRFADSISQQKFNGAIELGKHQFSGIIKRSEAGKWVNPTYRIERDGEKSLKLIRLESAKSGGSGVAIDHSIEGNWGLTPLGYFIAIGFSTAAIIILGIWLFRRKGRKLG
jgi:hypothetical protein